MNSPSSSAAGFRHGEALAFVVGGFLGLADRVVEKADMRMSLSRMTFSHELARVLLLEQVYRALTVLGGRHYANEGIVHGQEDEQERTGRVPEAARREEGKHHP